MSTGPQPSTDGVIIVGAGLAGLYTALKLAPRPVTLIAVSEPGAGASSVWAQGGIAAAIGPDDSPALHAADTIAAGAGLVDAAMARLLAEEAPARIEDLARLGVPFDRDGHGAFVLGREAAHSRKRIVRVRGDRAGFAIMQTLVAVVRRTPSIQIASGWRVQALARAGQQIVGVWAEPRDNGAGEPMRLFAAPATVLATGGIGALYAVSTNPPEARGDGLAMAARAGALIADPEFVQFHPTAIAIGRDPAPLATEALRGEGAVLINERGERFMPARHPSAELAPRDVVSRAIHAELKRGGRVFLDCRAALGARFADAFPTVYGACRSAGIDPARDPIPVAPAAHFHMGGIAVDPFGRSTLPGLWACGEVASTGAHGANRLASNSLLEAVVMGERIARALESEPALRVRPEAPAPVSEPRPVLPAERLALRRFFTDQLGLERNAEGLAQALRRLGALDASPGAPEGTAAVVGLLVAAGAILRRESRGGHYRSDYPQTDETAPQRTFLTLADARRLASGLTPVGANETRAAP